MKKTYKAWFFLLAATVGFAFLFQLGATAQSGGAGVVKIVNPDGTIVIGAGQSAGFESGDVLVIQRNGTKVGLAHIDDVGASETTATVMKLEGGATARAGDLVAYQLMAGGTTQTEESAPSYTTNVETEQPPNIMKREWLSSQPAPTDYDAEINKYTAVLSKNAHDRNAMIHLADAYFKKGWYIHSVKWNQRAIEEKPAAAENDKLLSQIIRSYGYMNDPEKQKLYMDYLAKHYPTSVFVSMTQSSVVTSEDKFMPYWAKVGGPITDSAGLQKGGMRTMQKSPAEQIKTPGSAAAGIGDKFLHGRPELMAPGGVEQEPLQ